MPAAELLRQTSLDNQTLRALVKRGFAEVREEAVARDQAGNLGGVCTTSGLANKQPGRVGDSPLIGAGLYVDNEGGAAGATGVGEEVIRIPVVNPVELWVKFAVGLGVALLFLPMAIFFILRGISKRADPGATARFALLVGVLAAAAWYEFLFWSLYGMTSAVIVGVIAVGAAFVLATMRK